MNDGRGSVYADRSYIPCCRWVMADWRRYRLYIDIGRSKSPSVSFTSRICQTHSINTVSMLSSTVIDQSVPIFSTGYCTRDIQSHSLLHHHFILHMRLLIICQQVHQDQSTGIVGSWNGNGHPSGPRQIFCPENLRSICEIKAAIRSKPWGTHPRDGSGEQSPT